MKQWAGGRSVPVRCSVWWRFSIPSMRTGTRKREGVFVEHGVSVALRATCRAVVLPCDGCEGHSLILVNEFCSRATTNTHECYRNFKTTKIESHFKTGRVRFF